MSQPTTTETDGESSTERARDAGLHAAADRRLRWGTYLLALSSLGFVANGLAMLYRVFFTSGFEAGVETLGGVTYAELAARNHELAHYVAHLQVNVAGLMVAAGVAMAALSWFGVRRGRRWALSTTVAIPVVFLAHSLPVHGTAGFTYDALLHLGPGLVWLPALLGGAVLAFLGLRGDGGEPERDTSD